MKKKLLTISIILILLIIGKFWIGIYEDDEFVENHLFIKHRPIWKWKFYSPRGMSDLTLKDMSPDKRKEQLLFDEFVRSKMNCN